MPLLSGLQLDEFGLRMVVTGGDDFPSEAARLAIRLRKKQLEGIGNSADARICYN